MPSGQEVAAPVEQLVATDVQPSAVYIGPEEQMDFEMESSSGGARWTRNTLLRELRRRKQSAERQLERVNRAIAVAERNGEEVEIYNAIRAVLY